MNIIDIYEKYNVVQYDNKRCYLLDFTKRDYQIENTSPVYLSIDDTEFINNSWNSLVHDVAQYIVDEFNPSCETLCNFSLEWTKQKIFSNHTPDASHLLLSNGLTVLCNFRAVQSYMLLQDLIATYGYDLEKVKFLIYRRPVGENKELKKLIIAYRKEQFTNYAINVLKKDETYAKKVLSGIDSFEKLFKEKLPTYESFYLIDDIIIFYSIQDKFLQVLDEYCFVNNVGYDKQRKYKEGLTKRLKIYREILK